MRPQCEIVGCTLHVSVPEVPDERAHLCAGHAYALVGFVETNTYKAACWLARWTWEAPKEEFLQACGMIAEFDRERLLEWRRRNPTVRYASNKN